MATLVSVSFRHFAQLITRPGIPRTVLGVMLLLGLGSGMSGCAVVAVADAAVTVGATAVKAGAAVVGTAVDVTSAAVRAATGGAKKD